MMQKSCDVVPYQKSPQKHKCMESVCPLYLEAACPLYLKATTFERFHTDAVPKFIHRWRCRYFPQLGAPLILWATSSHSAPKSWITAGATPPQNEVLVMRSLYSVG